MVTKFLLFSQSHIEEKYPNKYVFLKHIFKSHFFIPEKDVIALIHLPCLTH